jgi:hypothetical protein
MPRADAVSHKHPFFAKRRFNHASPLECRTIAIKNFIGRLLKGCIYFSVKKQTRAFILSGVVARLAGITGLVRTFHLSGQAAVFRGFFVTSSRPALFTVDVHPD